MKTIFGPYTDFVMLCLFTAWVITMVTFVGLFIKGWLGKKGKRKNE